MGIAYDLRNKDFQEFLRIYYGILIEYETPKEEKAKSFRVVSDSVRNERRISFYQDWTDEDIMTRKDYVYTESGLPVTAEDRASSVRFAHYWRVRYAKLWSEFKESQKPGWQKRLKFYKHEGVEYQY